MECKFVQLDQWLQLVLLVDFTVSHFRWCFCLRQAILARGGRHYVLDLSPPGHTGTGKEALCSRPVSARPYWHGEEGIMFSTCLRQAILTRGGRHYVLDLSICSCHQTCVHDILKITNFDADWHKWSVGQEHEIIDFGGQTATCQGHMRLK